MFSLNNFGKRVARPVPPVPAPDCSRNMPEHINKILLFFVISVTARGLYLCLFSNCHSADLVNWNRIGDLLLAGENPYKETGFLNWPPLWMQLIFLFKKISLATHCSFFTVVRAFLILVEGVAGVLLYATLLRYTKFKNAAGLLIFGVALNPIAILQVCQQCNFDVLVGFWVMLALYMLLRFQERQEARFWLFACLAIGMGIVTKTIPLCLQPLLLISARKLKLTEWIIGAALTFTPMMLGLSIIYVLGPDDVETKVLGYRSIPGDFGLTGFLAYFQAGHLLKIYPRIFEIVYGAGWLGLGGWLLSKPALNVRQIVSIAAALLLAIPAMGPGYNPEYVCWFLPLLLLLYGLEGRIIRGFLLGFYLVGAATYLVEYGLFWQTRGAFLLDIMQNEKLLKFANDLYLPIHQTLLRLPLWILYFVAVAFLCARIAKDMVLDFKTPGSLITSRNLRSPGQMTTPENPC